MERDSHLPLEEKIAAGRRLDVDDALALFSPAVDLHRLGQWADAQRHRRHGDRAYYNRNAHLNPTNVCLYRCPVCAYSCDEGDPRGFVLDDEAILEAAGRAAAGGCTELHIVGGLHPRHGFDWHLRLIASVHAAYPDLHLKAWTAVEIAHFAALENCGVEAILRRLIDAGLGSLPGGGAEIFAPDVRRRVSPKKADAQTWLDVHRTAHRLGLRSTATMLCGHVESAADRVDHLLRLRTLQDETGGFQAFIPLSFHPQNTALADVVKQTGLDVLRTIAASRLILDNVDHIKAYWVSLGVGVAQAALAYGADDLDGTVVEESIHHEAGATSPSGLSVAELCRLIAEAGCRPIERDSLYRPVLR